MPPPYVPQVLTKLSAFYLRSVYGPDWQMKAPIKLCDRYFAGTKASDEHEEVVVLSKVLSSELNNGYQDLGNIQVNRAIKPASADML